MKISLCFFKGRFTVLTLLAMLCLRSGMNAQTTLGAGDIAFTGYNSSNAGAIQNEFSFILLTNISAGTTINFTDNGFKIAAVNALNTTEGTLVWTSTTAMARFTQVFIQISAAGNGVTSLSAGSIAGGFSNFILSTVGDQILAYQGSSASPTFISGIHMNSDAGISTQGGWDNIPSGTTFTQNRSDVPPGLTGGATCVAPDPNIGTSEKDNGVYNCTGSTGAAINSIRTAINTPANWSIQDNVLYTLPPSCTFSLASPLTATITGTNVLCNGTNTGAASVSVSGGVPAYSYAWAPSGGTAATATGLSAGNYTVTITDGASTVITRTITITQPSALSTVTAFTNTSCFGGGNGRASVSVTGGTGAYTYTWSPSGGNASLATGLGAGSYTVTVRDANNCVTTNTSTVTQPSSITAVASSTAISCNGGSNGAASVSVSGGTPGYFYSWAPSGGTGSTATGLTAGNYTVTTTDNNSCTRSTTVAVTQPSAINTATSIVNVSCNGFSNGVAAVSASGGAGSYTYTWSPTGGNSAVATGLAAGAYSVTVRDANGCIVNRVATITQPSAIVSSVSFTNVSCNGGSNGRATVTASGGTPGYLYSWAPSGGTNPTATGLSVGTYTCTIDDGNGCQKTQTVTIGQPAVIAAVTSQTNATCGSSNGAASVSAAGGAGAYTYSWTPSGGTGATASGLASGNYTVTITDANSCARTATVNITSSAIVTTTAVTNVACNGGSNGVASVTASGGAGGYTYLWSNGGTTSAITGLMAGIYTVTVTDAGSCTRAATATVTQPSALSTSTAVTNVACNGGSNGVASITASGGAGSYTYLWSNGGSTSAITGLMAGVYTATVTDANSCTSIKSAIVTQPSSLATSTAVTNVACNGGSNGVASITASGGAGGYTYLWSNGGSTSAITGLMAGVYTATVTDANSCKSIKAATVNQPSSIVTSTAVTNVACNGGSNGVASITASGGAGGYTYLWSNGGTTSAITGLLAGVYTATVTDANSCTSIKSAIVTQPSALSTSTAVTNVACNGGSNGVASITASGGVGSYTYLWSNGGSTSAITGLLAGVYTATVTDANSCTSIKSAIVTQPSALSTSTAVTNVACNGGSNGVASITASGGAVSYTYLWSNGGSTSAITGLLAGVYTATVTDANSCTSIKSAIVTQPSALSTSTAVTNVACNGGSNGVASITASGGAGSYTYLWSSGGTTSAITGLMAGVYTATVTDANSCTKTATATVTQSSAIATTTSVTNVACNGGSNGVASITASGGAGSYTYLWSNGGSTSAITGLMAGVYTATVTDANSCTKTATATVTQPSAIATTTAVTNVACNGGSNGVASITASGGAGGYTYVWSNGGSTSAITGLMSGVYTATVTDANSCTSIKAATVTQPTAISTTTSVTNVSCNGGSNGIATVTATGGAGGYTYSWTPSGGTGATASGLAQGNYTVTVTDANSCTKTAFATLTQPTAISTTTSVTNVSCNGGSNGSATVVASGGIGSYSYSWAPSGGTGATASGRTAGNYTVTITDANSCTKTAFATITQPTAISTTTSITNVSCNGGSNGSATVVASGGTGSYTYSWAPSGGTGASASGLTSGNYTVTITDANSCTKTAFANVTQPTAISTTTSVVNVSCNGGSNGVATVVASGGTGSYTYSWTPSGGTGASASGLASGNYTVTVTDGNGCTKTAVANVTQPTAITSTATQTNATCGVNNGSASVSVSGGTGSYTYSWMPSGGTAATAGSLGAGAYTVTITDANLCVKTQTVTITASGNISGVITTTAVSCNGGNDGVASVSATGGTGAYTYTWMPGNISTATASGLTSGAYTVQVKDATTCTVSFTANITQPVVLTTSTTFTNITCNGAANGIATASVSGGTGAYSYTWTPTGGNAATASGLAPGTYTVNVKDANNCTLSRTVSITQPLALSATISGTNISCNGGTNGTTGVTVSGGTGAYTYSWTPTGGTAATATGLAANNYTVTIKDANLCTITRTISLTEPASLTAVTSQTNLTCNGASNGDANITVSGGTGAYTYSWTPAGGTASTATGLAANNYTVTVKDANNCSIARTYTITQPTVLAATTSNTNIICNGAANGIATTSVSGGTGAYSYTWTPTGGNAATASGLAPGTYTVNVKDANNCTLSRTVSITEPTALSATISGTNVSCGGGMNGAAGVTVSGGTGAYTYSWTPTGGTAATASGLAANNYTVTIKDANLCTITRTIAVTEPASMTAVTSQTNLTCNGANNGAANITVSGGAGSYTYSWTPAGGTASTATGLAANNYTVTVKDANNCSIARTYTITQPAVLLVTVSHTNITCNGAANGIATTSVSGGTGAYTYSWTPAAVTTSTAGGLNAGTYTVIVKDANLCQATGTVSITQPTALAAISSQTNAVCNGAANGAASVTVSGGTGAYSYTWAPTGGNASSATGLTAGNYSVTVKDANNCMLTQTLVITEPSAIVATVSRTNISCFGLTNGSATVTATGGNGALTYTWMPGGSNATSISNLSTGTYTVNVKDISNCQVSATVTIIQPAAIVYTQSLSVCQGQSVMVGTSVYSVAGTYTNVLVATGGCDSTVTTVLTLSPPPTLTITANSPTVCAGTSATLTATGATTYTWTSGVTNGVGFTPAATQTYTVTGANGSCISTATISLNVNPKPSVVINATSTLICKENTVILSGSGASTYSWTGGVINGTAFSPTTTATYTVTGTNTNGCSNTAMITVSVNPCTGIESYDSGVTVMVYPNPVNSTATVNISNFDQLTSGHVSLDLYDNTGRMVKHVIITGAETVLSREGLADGIYYYHVTSDGAALLKGKLVVQ